MLRCFYCGRPGDRPLKTTDSFDKSLVRNPFSRVMCCRCEAVMFGELQMAWYQREDGSWSNVWSRNFSWLLRNPNDLLDPSNQPTFGPLQTVPGKGRGKAWRVVSSLPSRLQIRAWLINPPEPPFEIVIAISGQKHTLFASETAQSRDCFSVQFETEQIWVDRAVFIRLLDLFEQLYSLGFSKEQIYSGNYRPAAVASAFSDWSRLEPQIKPYRGSQLLTLAAHVAQKQEDQGASPGPQGPDPTPAQLSLF